MFLTNILSGKTRKLGLPSQPKVIYPVNGGAGVHIYTRFISKPELLTTILLLLDQNSRGNLYSLDNYYKSIYQKTPWIIVLN